MIWICPSLRNWRTGLETSQTIEFSYWFCCGSVAQ